MKSSVYPKTVALLITKQCTAQCEMCCFECTPQTKEKIPMELIIKIIEEAALIDDIETIGFSGGEPFLEYFNSKRVHMLPIFMEVCGLALF